MGRESNLYSNLVFSIGGWLELCFRILVEGFGRVWSFSLGPELSHPHNCVGVVQSDGRSDLI